MNTKAFNNIMVWRLVEPIREDRVDLSAALGDHPAKVPGAGAMQAEGFIPPLGRDELYVEGIDAETSLIALNVAKRMLPGKIVKRAVEQEARKIAEAEGRKVFAREKQRIKEQVLEQLLPRAFVDHSQVYALLTRDYIILGTSSAKTGERLLDALRAALPGGLKVVPVHLHGTPISSFTHWFGYGDVRGSDRFSLGSDFTVHGTASESEAIKGSWPFSTDETLSDWIAQGGQRVTALGLNWHSPTLETDVPFVVNEMLGLKSIKWPPELLHKANDDAGDDAEEIDMAIATLMILAAEFRELWRDLLMALGGEAIPNAGHGHQTEDDDDDGLI